MGKVLSVWLGRASLRAIVGMVLLVSTTQAHAQQPSSVLERMNTLVAMCQNTTQDIMHEGERLVCFTGRIGEEKVSPLLENGVKIDTLLINSEGGDVDTAILLGLRLHEDRTRVVVNQACYSACANYIIPAAKSVSVHPRSLVIMHGSIPRSAREYAEFLYGTGRVEDFEQAREAAVSRFPGIRDGILNRERLFFDRVFVSSGYLGRFFNLIQQRKNGRIQEKAVRLIVDEKYMQMFGIEVESFDDDSSRFNGDLISNRFSSKFDFIYGYDGEEI